MTTTDAQTSEDEADNLTYTSAVAELDEILLELEDEALDVDVLADRVERASTLVRFCRTRITSARTQVSKIVADLDELATDE
ncbi:MAG: exodeoxyribonuclease VII small subunit [Acidimicrobiia bacterium]|nr:exodeoxyribonuclease VII small subunit [Acidimicrobiia bacterium]